jgi:hypothetical protein
MLVEEASDVLPGQPAADHTIAWVVLLAEAWQQQEQLLAQCKGQNNSRELVTYRDNTFCDLQLTGCLVSC